MKVIDLLNKIANGEEIPKNIKYKENDYYLFDSKSYLTTDKSRFFDTIYFKELNDEVEIIEEDKKIEIIEEDKKIEKLEYYKITDETIEKLIPTLNVLQMDFINIINELIDEVNKINEKQ